MNKGDTILRNLLSKGYSYHLAPLTDTGKHQSMFVKDVLGIPMKHYAKKEFVILESDYQKIIDDAKWLPDNVEAAFVDMAITINESIKEYIDKAEPDDHVYVVMGLFPPNYHFGKLITSIADPSNGMVITLSLGQDGDEMVWSIYCLWGIKISKE